MPNLNPAQTDCTCTGSVQRSKIKNFVFVNKLTHSTQNREFLSVQREGVQPLHTKNTVTWPWCTGESSAIGWPGQTTILKTEKICNMQAPFSPHIRDIRNIYRSAECKFTQKMITKRELIGRDVSECLVMWIIAGQRQIGLVWMILTQGGWPHRPEEPFWWLTALQSPLCSLITVFKVNASTAALQGTWHHKSFLSLKKREKARPVRIKNYLPITISNYDVYSPFVLLYAILGAFFVKQRFSKIGWYRLLFKANWGKERADRGGELNCPQPAVTTLNWWDAKERKQNRIFLRFAGSSRSSACQHSHAAQAQ